MIKMSKIRKIDMVILGLLEHENLTGYDIKKQIDGAINFFWKASFGSIYPALKDLEKNGLIKKIKEDYPNIELFVSLNKNIFNSDLIILEKTLFELAKIDIKG